MHARTLYDKLWDSHVVRQQDDGTALIYVDRHLVHEVTSPQAYEGLRLAGRTPWRVESIVATADHNTPTTHWDEGIRDPISRTQVEALDANIRSFGAKAYFPFRDRRQGIVHVIGPESGATLPGMTVVCGDSHTSTHGAFAALAFGIGTSEVEHVLATQCLLMKKAKSMLIRVDRALPPGVTRERPRAVDHRAHRHRRRHRACDRVRRRCRARAVDGRADDGVQHVDRGRRARRHGRRRRAHARLPARDGRLRRPADTWTRAVEYWRTLVSDAGAKFDTTHVFDAAQVRPQVTWGTSPEMVVSIEDRVPDPDRERNGERREGIARALEYMGLTPNVPITDIRIDKVFIGSCTNSRIEDLREAAGIARGRHVAGSVRLAMVVPGSGLVKAQAEAEGLDRTFRDAGFEWREPGCSMCLAMNDDRLEPGERCASTSNRNFEGRQGAGGRTHLVSPAMAAAAAIAGHFVDVRRLC